jgi:protein farnesyltransferase/geranylgeranyltransferase type-1 subunit alpha
MEKVAWSFFLPKRDDMEVDFSSPEWKDVTPIPQDDGPNPLVPIMYEERYRILMDYFRGLQATNDHTYRALSLTAEILELNASHYSVWFLSCSCRKYRLDTLLQLKEVDWEQEMEFINYLGAENPKSYQIW